MQKDRMDKSAMGHDYVGKTEAHSSQKDHSAGFGGKYGVQKDRMDKSAEGHDFIGKTDTHSSVTDAKRGEPLKLTCSGGTVLPKRKTERSL